MDDTRDRSLKTLPFNRHYFLWGLQFDRPQAAEDNDGGPFSLFAQTPEEYFDMCPPTVAGAATAVRLQGGGPRGDIHTADPNDLAAAAARIAAALGLTWAAAQAPYVVDAAAVTSSRRPSSTDATAEGAAHAVDFETLDHSRLLAQGGAVEALLANEAEDSGGLSSAGQSGEAGPGRLRPAAVVDLVLGASIPSTRI